MRCVFSCRWLVYVRLESVGRKRALLYRDIQKHLEIKTLQQRFHATCSVDASTFDMKSFAGAVCAHEYERCIELRTMFDNKCCVYTLLTRIPASSPQVKVLQRTYSSSHLA